MARDFETSDFHYLQHAQFELFGDGPARNEPDSESGFHGRLDGFGGIEIHHTLESLELQAGFLDESSFDDAAGAGTLFAHEKIRREELLGERGDRTRNPAT